MFRVRYGLNFQIQLSKCHLSECSYTVYMNVTHNILPNIIIHIHINKYNNFSDDVVDNNIFKFTATVANYTECYVVNELRNKLGNSSFAVYKIHRPS